MEVDPHTGRFLPSTFLGISANKAHPHYMIPHIWLAMKRRCENSSDKGWKRYGGRGICICERWQTFENFYHDMGPTYFPHATIERIDNESGYTPENCCWATKKEQNRNRRTSIKVSLNGTEHNLYDLVREHGIPKATAFYRYHRGWPIERVLGL